MQRLRVQSPKLIIHGDEKNKGTPRTNTRKVVCTECGTNINSENKIIHSKRVHPGKIVKFQPHLESGQQVLNFFGGLLNTTVENNINTTKAEV